jgi:CheY-like chemotaxis protein
MSDSTRIHRALVVEDDGAVRDLLAEMLELRGLEVEAVGSADEALTVLEAGTMPDVIVLDRRMPGMSGDELLERVRANPAWAHILVAMVSGMPHGERRLETEPDAYLEKPFDVDTLEEALSRMGAG